MKVSLFIFAALVVAMACFEIEVAKGEATRAQLREAEAQLSHERQYTMRLSQILSQQESRKQLTPAHASHE
jgi:predicted component of type VI protein secretion system